MNFSEYWCQNWCTLQEMLHHCAADEWSLFVSSSPVSLAVSTMNLMTKWRGTELNLTRVKRYRNWWFIVFLQISSFTRHQASSDCHPQPEIIGDSYLVCITMPALEFGLFLEHCKMNTYTIISIAKCRCSSVVLDYRSCLRKESRICGIIQSWWMMFWIWMQILTLSSD